MARPSSFEDIVSLFASIGVQNAPCMQSAVQWVGQVLDNCRSGSPQRRFRNGEDVCSLFTMHIDLLRAYWRPRLRVHNTEALNQRAWTPSLPKAVKVLPKPRARGLLSLQEPNSQVGVHDAFLNQLHWSYNEWFCSLNKGHTSTWSSVAIGTWTTTGH